MRKIMTTFALMFAIASVQAQMTFERQHDKPHRAPISTLLSQGFEGLATGQPLPVGWTRHGIGVGTTHNWLTAGGLNLGSLAYPFVIWPHSGDRQQVIQWSPTDDLDAWLISSGVTLTAGTTYHFIFHVVMPGDPDDWGNSRLAVRVGRENTVDAMNAGTEIYRNVDQSIDSWTRISVAYQATETGPHFFGFHAFNEADKGWFIQLDDISLIRPRENDLAIIVEPFAFPYTQMPIGLLAQEITWTPAPALIANIGNNPMTDVVTTVNLNDNLLETSTPIPSIAPAGSEVVTFGEQTFNSATLTLGQSKSFTLNYSVKATENDEDPTDNVFERTDTVIGTTNILAMHRGMRFQRDLQHWGTGGNVFTIANTVTLEEVSVDLFTTTTTDQRFLIDLFRVDEQGRVIVGVFENNQWQDALFEVEAIRPAGTVGQVATHIVPVPPTILTPGRYFLAVTQATPASIGLVSDGRTAIPSFEFGRRSGGYAELITPTIGGAWNISMVLADLDVFSKIPASGTENVLLNEEIRVVFTAGITDINLDLITVTPNIVGDFVASIDDNVLIIAHNGLDPGIVYTITIPVGTIANIDDEISWSFETVEGYDAAIIAITSPICGVNLTNEIVIATIKNFGGNTITTMDMELTVNGTVVATEPFTGNIPSGVFNDFTFTALADLSTTRHNTITVRAILTDDQDADNDSYTISVLNCFPTVATNFEQDFENTAFPPACWMVHRVNLDNPADTWRRDVTTPLRPGSTGHTRHPFPTIMTAQTSMLITEVIEVPASGIYELTFWTRWSFAGNAVHRLGVWASNTDNDPASFSPIFELSTAVGGQSVTLSPWVEVAVSLEQFQGQIIYLAFRYEGDRTAGASAPNWDIDDVSIQPALLRMVSQTPAPNASGVATDQDIVVTFNVDVDYSNFDGVLVEPPIAGFAVNLVNNRDLTITHYGLEYATAYTVTIPAGTIIGFDSTLIWSFRTTPLCNPVVAFPWEEGFECAEFFPPDCWTLHRENIAAATFVRGTTTAVAVRTGTGGVSHTNIIETVSQRSMLITEAITLSNDAEYHLDFWSRAGTIVNAPINATVMVSTSNDPASFVTTLGSAITVSGTQWAWGSWTQTILSLNDFRGQTIYLAFVYTSPLGQATTGWAIDDISVTTIEEHATNVQQIGVSVVTIYPNPVDDILHIQTTELVRRIEIFNLQGTLVLATEDIRSYINVSHLPAGVYMIRFITDTGISTQRFVKR